MMPYFLVTNSHTGPIGSIYHDELPLIDTKRRQLPNNGPSVLYGPVEIPPQFVGQPIKVLMAVWRGEKPKLVRA